MLETSNIVVKPFKRLKTFKVSVKRICYCSFLTLAHNILQSALESHFRISIATSCFCEILYFKYILGPGLTVYTHLGSWVDGVYTSRVLGGRCIHILGPGWTVYTHLGSWVDGVYTSRVLGGRCIHIQGPGWTGKVSLTNFFNALSRKVEKLQR